MGAVLGLERLDIVRHLATPAHVKTRNARYSAAKGTAERAQPVLPCRPGNAATVCSGTEWISLPLPRRQVFFAILPQPFSGGPGRGPVGCDRLHAAEDIDTNSSKPIA